MLPNFFFLTVIVMAIFFPFIFHKRPNSIMSHESGISFTKTGLQRRKRLKNIYPTRIT